MSAPSTGVPAQGGVAPTAVEEAAGIVDALQAKEEIKKLKEEKEKLEEEKEKVWAVQEAVRHELDAENGDLLQQKKELRAQITLQQAKIEKLEAEEEKVQAAEEKLQEEKEELQAQITALEKRLDGEDVNLKEAGVHGLGPQPTADTIKVKLAELKKSSEFVNERLKLTKQLEKVTGSLLASAQRATLSDEEERDLLLARWARSLPIEAFNESHSTSSEASSEFRDAELVACVVCGKTDGLSRAHIIQSRRKCESLGMGYSDNSNVLVLCGRKGVFHSCQHMFDVGQMAFQHVRAKDGWVVWGGSKHHAKELTFRNEPSRSALHALTSCGACGTGVCCWAPAKRSASQRRE